MLSAGFVVAASLLPVVVVAVVGTVVWVVFGAVAGAAVGTAVGTVVGAVVGAVVAAVEPVALRSEIHAVGFGPRGVVPPYYVVPMPPPTVFYTQHFVLELLQGSQWRTQQSYRF